MEFRKYLGSPVTLAWIAIGVSVAQFLVSFPLVNSYYSSPKISISGASTPSGIKVSKSIYTLKNTGHGSATNVELGLILKIGDKIIVMPDIAGPIARDSDPVMIDHARVNFAKLLPGEEVAVMVVGSNESGFSDEFLDFINKTKINIPSVSYLRSDQGSGVVNQIFKSMADDVITFKKTSEDTSARKEVGGKAP